MFDQFHQPILFLLSISNWLINRFIFSLAGFFLSHGNNRQMNECNGNANWTNLNACNWNTYRLWKTSIPRQENRDSMNSVRYTIHSKIRKIYSNSRTYEWCESSKNHENQNHFDANRELFVLCRAFYLSSSHRSLSPSL